MTRPIPCIFMGDHWAIRPAFQKAAREIYGRGEVVTLAPVEERSMVSHAHEFAWLKDAWMNLPEQYAGQFPTPDHLRKRALIDAGFYDEQIIDVGTQAACLRVARAIGAREEFSVVVVKAPFVIIRTAKSQARGKMDRAEFQASKTAIMETVAAMIGVTAEDLKSNTPGAVSGKAGPPQPSGSITEAVPQANMEAA